MSRKKTQRIITTLAVAIATILAWLSGFFVMQIVYDSIAAAITFGTVCAIIVFCESRFSYISLKSDGRIEITKEEIKSNLGQIIAATSVAFLVTIPLELKLYGKEIVAKVGDSADNLGMHLQAFGELFPSNWVLMVLACMLVIGIFNVPIIIKMMSDKKE